MAKERIIAVCAAEAAELEAMANAVHSAGVGAVLPVQGADADALNAAAETATLYLLHTGKHHDALDAELADRLAARPDPAALIVVGADPAPRAKPTCWFPQLPKADVLGGLIAQLVLPRAQSMSLRSPVSWRRKTDMILGGSAAVRQIIASIDQLAPAQTPVIITGESGVGKELIARALHYCGPRAKEPFIALNCAAIPESLFEAELFGYQRGAFTGAVQSHAGAFEAAHKGTLFLDEIGEMPLAMQAKLLRVLETSEVVRIGSNEPKKVSLRLVTATNLKLEREVKEGRFRGDLYYRVRVFPLHVPPLRERMEDVPPIAIHHLGIIAARENRPALRMSPLALEKVLAYPFPGNVRELVNLLERAALMARNNVIEPEHIVMPQFSQAPPPAAPLASYKDAKQKFEYDYYTQLMKVAGGNVSLASKLGQKTRKEIYDALKRLELEPTTYRSTDVESEEVRVSDPDPRGRNRA